MLEREDRLDVQGVTKYLVNIVKPFVEQPDKVEVTFDEFPRKVIFHLSVAEIDLSALESVQFVYRALNHIMNKVTQANLGKSGSLDNEFGIST